MPTNLFLSPLAAVLSLLALPSFAAGMQDGHCDGAADKGFICGPANAEDLIKVPGGDWVLASRMAGPGVSGGGIYLIDTRSGAWRNLDIDAMAEKRDPALPQCPGKPTMASFSGHGITLAKDGDGLRLLAINHGGRETVEVFSVGLESSAEPALAWTGCVSAPAGAVLNSIVALPEGGFAATKFFDASNKTWADDLFTGKPTGSVLEWPRNGGWREVEGSASSGPNGLAVSPDGKTYFVAAWGERKLFKVPRDGGAASAVNTGVLADNVHWADDGKLLLTGQDVADKRDYAACALSEAKVCPDAYKVLSIDPETLVVEEIAAKAGTKEFGSGTTALDLGGEYWIGTSRGDRIARIAKP